MAELQHNGAATGLIDFTYSSLVALYFASSDLGNENGAVYFINTRDSTKLKRIEPTDLEKTFKDLLKNSDNVLWFWEPSDLNNRILLQHSTFIFGDPEINKEFVKTIQIAEEGKLTILSELEKLHNISTATLSMI